MKQVRLILELLSHHLQVKACNSFFRKHSMHYLGFLIDQDGIHLDPSRLKALADCPVPSSATKLKIFLGGINFYYKFIANFYHISRPLHQLSNYRQFQWTPRATQQFQNLQVALFSASVLQFPNFTQPFKIESNASQYVIGVVLKQGGHPIAYHLEMLVDAKLNYNTYEKEFYNLVQELKEWRHYVLGKETILHIDHHPLIFINSQSKIQEQRHLK